MIAAVSYQLQLDLTQNPNEFQGTVTLHFDLKPKAKDSSEPLLLDLEGGKIQSLQLNGSPLSAPSIAKNFNGHHLTFKTDELKPTHNELKITYTQSYHHDGRGLHRFEDPSDGNSYLFTHFEPYDAHRMFPCFDQPDLKASYELQVVAPSQWQIISYALPQKVLTQDKTKTWIFPQSAVFSTYLLSLHAGPYAVWQSHAEEIPIRLFARKSIAQYIDYEEWLKITRQGLEYFGIQFGYPYAFGKYDQIIVPDFNSGAMENVGAVTFSEAFVHRTRVTHDQLMRRANTILHEMAHMWFGDLVTLRWWNGLWLNESFATFMASKAVDEATDFKGSWQSFFSGVKQWAYWEDQLVTTHPIEVPVANTDVAQSLFDGITYGKGAAVLKQLDSYIGDEEFKEGLQRYFQKYAFKNTTLNEFFKMLSEASSTDLGPWEKLWLQTSGVNTTRADWECKVDPDTTESVISKFDLIQNKNQPGKDEAGTPVLRPHHAEMRLFYFSKHHSRKHLRKRKDFDLKNAIFETTYEREKTTIQELIGKPCPDLVFPNNKDYDYTKVELDPVSLKHTLKSMGEINDPFTRQMLWHTLWEMVTDGQLKAQDYAETVLQYAAREKDTQVLSKILQHLASTSLGAPSVPKYLNPELRKKYETKVEAFVDKQLLHAPSGSDLQLIWYRTFLEAAVSPHAISKLTHILNGKLKLRGFTLDQEHRWQLIQALALRNAPEIQQTIALELKKDPTDMGQKAAIAAESAIPDASVKKKWFDLLLQPTATLPVSKLRVAMRSFHVLGQENLSRPFAQAYFESIPKMNLSTSDEKEEALKNFAQNMFPALCDPENIRQTSALLEAHPELPATVIKSLKINRQEEERCIRARQKSAE
jgi:aminopeptidase N